MNPITHSAPSGVMAALATPLQTGGNLDYDGLLRLLRHIQGAPVNGICPVGSTGEGPLLSRDLRLEVTRVTVEATSDQVIVIPAAVGLTIRDVIEDSISYSRVGADAVLVPPLFYYPLDQRSVRNYYLSVAEESPLPIIIYNIPQMTKISVAPELVAELAMHPNIVGIKDSSRDFEYFATICEAADRAGANNFSPLTGTDTMLLASILVGGKGTIAASVNLVPGLVCDLYEAVMTGNFENANVLQRRLMRIVFAARKPGFPLGWKTALSLAGICDANPAAPSQDPATDDSIKLLSDSLQNLLFDQTIKNSRS